MLLLVAERIIAAEPHLSEADRNLGDGDHGLGMQRGLTAAREKLMAFPDDGSVTIDKLFSTVGMAMMSSMGGASGAIFEGRLEVEAIGVAAKYDGFGRAGQTMAGCGKKAPA